MSKPFKSGKQTVELKPSRIRRDPVRTPDLPGATKPARWDPSERETWIVVIGVILFALAITIITFGISDATAG